MSRSIHAPALLALGCLALGCLALSGCMAQEAQSDKAEPVNTERQLLFAEEFNAPALDRTKWNVVGPEFWVNREQQAYVDDQRTIQFAENIEGADGGALVLRPVYAPGEDTLAERDAPFISGRINSRDKFDFAFGRAEARIRMPDAQGVWPAFWLLGNGQWPQTGEIDIMEYVGEKDWTGVAVHGTGYSGDAGLDNRFFFEDGTDATDWHVYAVEWTRNSMEFEIDGRLTFRVTRPMTQFFGGWHFDNPKFLILNFAMGGVYPAKTSGIEDPYYGIPQATVDMVRDGKGDVAMYVDWVRVYAPQ